MKKFYNYHRAGICFPVLILLALQTTVLYSQIRPHHIFDNNMILQREKPAKVWGWATPGETVAVEFNGQSKTTVTSASGEWILYLDPMAANRAPQDFIVSGKGNSIKFTNVLVGDIWILGGQSNMEFDLIRIFHGDTEVLSANFPEIRLMTIPSAEGLEAQSDFERINEYDSWLDRYDEKGYWFVCSPERVKTFSGLGYIFGKCLHMVSQIPIGLIDVSRGGTTLESWISPEKLKKSPENKLLLTDWNDKVASYNPEEDLKKKIKNWEKRTETRLAQGLQPGPKPTEPAPNPITDKNFPGSCYNGMIAVIAGLSAKGILFHHGYNNALSDARPVLYSENFKNLINDWRETFNDKNMPFGIVELSAGRVPQTPDNFETSMIDAAPYIRGAQLESYLHLNNIGFACAYDQQVNWYHPQKKVELSERIARWALNTQYGFDLDWEPALLRNFEIKENKITVTFDKEVATFDDRPVEGFAVADSSGRFYPATATYVTNGKNDEGNPEFDKTRLEVSSRFVSQPVAVRYAWARNPLGNLVNAKQKIIPAALFRTDNWNYPEAPYRELELEAHRKELRDLKNGAMKHDQERIW